MAWGLRSGTYANNGAGVQIGTGATSGSTTIAPGAAVSGGDLLVLHVLAVNLSSGGSVPTISVSDSINGAWSTADETNTNNVAGLNERQSVFSFPNSGGGTPTITISSTWTGTTGTNIGAEVIAFSGIQTTSPKDVSISATGTSNTPSSGTTSATTGASELVVGCYGDYGEGHTITEGAGFTLGGKHESDSGRYQALLEYKDSGSSGTTQSAGVTLPAGNGGWAMFCVVYKIFFVAQDTPELYGRMKNGLSTSRQMNQLLAF